MRDPFGVFHVTSRTNNKEWFTARLEEIWEIFTHRLARACERYGTEIHAFVLMANHFHLLLSDPRTNLDDSMRYLLTNVSKDIGSEEGRINHIFGGRYRWTFLNDGDSVGYVYKYICRNPVRAGVCARVQDYRYSSISALIRRDLRLPVSERVDRLFLFARKTLAQRLSWLNYSPVAVEDEKLIGRALRRYEFRFSRGNSERWQLERLRKGYGVESEMTATFSAGKVTDTFRDLVGAQEPVTAAIQFP